MILKIQNFQSKLETITKLKKNPIGIFGHENKEKYPIYLSENAL